MSLSTSTHLPSLPLEVKGHILRFCDPSTLAVTSRVSLAFLELSIPILHDDIHVKSFGMLEDLFCSRNGQLPSSLDDILSLSYTRTFTIMRTDDDEPLTHLSHHRLANGRSLPVSRLNLMLSGPEDGDRSDDPWGSVLHLFDPEMARVSYPAEIECERLGLNLGSATWSRLRSLELVGCTSTNYLGHSDFFRQQSQAGTQIPLAVVYDLAEKGWDGPLWNEIAADLCVDQPRCDMSGLASRLTEVVVRVRSREAEDNSAEHLTSAMGHLPEAERTRRLALIKYEVTEPAPKADASR